MHNYIEIKYYYIYNVVTAAVTLYNLLHCAILYEMIYMRIFCTVSDTNIVDHNINDAVLCVRW